MNVDEWLKSRLYELKTSTGLNPVTEDLVLYCKSEWSKRYVTGQKNQFPTWRFCCEILVSCLSVVGVEHLALEIDASNKGLKLLLEGCTRLKSLHIGSR